MIIIIYIDNLIFSYTPCMLPLPFLYRFIKITRTGNYNTSRYFSNNINFINIVRGILQKGCRLNKILLRYGQGLCNRLWHWLRFNISIPMFLPFNKSLLFVDSFMIFTSCIIWWFREASGVSTCELLLYESILYTGYFVAQNVMLLVEFNSFVCYWFFPLF